MVSNDISYDIWNQDFAELPWPKNLKSFWLETFNAAQRSI